MHLHGNANLCGLLPDIPGADIQCYNTSIGDRVKLSLEYSSFSFFVCPVSKLSKLQKFVPFEEAIKDGLIVQLQCVSWATRFSCWTIKGQSISEKGAWIYRENLLFISHRWIGDNFPDDDFNTKLIQLRKLVRQKEFSRVKYFWLDFLCIPQHEKHLEKRLRAINSLPFYIRCCSSFVSLVGNTGKSLRDIYVNRGWCRLERLSALIPIEDDDKQVLFAQIFEHNKDTLLLTPVQVFPPLCCTIYCFLSELGHMLTMLHIQKQQLLTHTNEMCRS